MTTTCGGTERWGLRSERRCVLCPRRREEPVGTRSRLRRTGGGRSAAMLTVDHKVVCRPDAHFLRRRRRATALSGTRVLPGLLCRDRLDRDRCNGPHGLRVYVLRGAERAEVPKRADFGRCGALEHQRARECLR